MKIRTCVAAVAAVTVLPLATACGTDSSGTAERAPKKAANAEAADCGEDSDLSQAEWMEKCADDAGDEKAPDTELKVGDTFKYKDGLKVTVTGIERFNKFGEFDSKPTGGQQAFRINIKFENGSKKPVDLDAFSVNGQGATKGGDAEFTMWDQGSKEITGRLAPGQTDTKNDDGMLDKKYGTQLLVTVSRVTEDDFLEEDPHWTGPIR